MLKKPWYGLAVILLVAIMTGCNSNYAPVTSAFNTHAADGAVHRVSRGETLYAIAWRYNMDYRKIAAFNHLQPPYKLLVGERLRLKSPATPMRPHFYHYVTPGRTHLRPLGGTRRTTAIATIANWQWPARGKLIGGYAPSNGFKGINIAGVMGSPVLAAASGRIAYCGNDLRGYGNLIIIKHNDEYLSAYAHNSQNLVKEGQLVSAGQVIAKMGNTEATRVMLHFEIRKAGKSVNPLRYLK